MIGWYNDPNIFLSPCGVFPNLARKSSYHYLFKFIQAVALISAKQEKEKKAALIIF